MTQHEQSEPTRRPAGIATAVVFAAIAAGLLTAAIINGGWWWLSMFLAAPLALFAAVGLAVDATKRPRDAKGRAIKRPPSD